MDAPTSTPVIANNTVMGNSGQGICWGNASPAVVNNIVAFNYAGVGLFLPAANTASLRNNCIYGNGDPFLNRNYVNMPEATGAHGNFSADPLLVDRFYGDAHIQPGSPCIDAGDPTVVQNGWTDIDGQPRTRAGQVDVGADQSDGAVQVSHAIRVYVRPDGNDASSGATWADAKKSLQAAMDLASVLGGEVWVKAGTYTGNFIVHPYVYVYGGFNGTENTLAQRDVKANATILDGNKAAATVTLQGGYRVSRVDGLTVQNGYGADAGGGVLVNVASPIVTNCTIAGNTAYFDGGGMEIHACFGVIASNRITGNVLLNTLDGKGGGIHVQHSGPLIYGNEIDANKGMAGTGFESDGDSIDLLYNSIHDNVSAGFLYANYGGAYIVASDAVVMGNMIYNNAAIYGGGLALLQSSGRVVDNVIGFNYADGEGGGMYCATIGNDTPLLIANNTFVANRAKYLIVEFGGALLISSFGPTVVNNIFAYNSSGVSRDVYAGAMPVFRNNCVWSNNNYNGAGFDYSGVTDPTGQAGNLRTDSKFVALNPFDPHLANGSPCIDAGDDTVLRLGETDAGGGLRLRGAHVDIGAYEAGALPPYTVEDVREALRILAGLDRPTIPDLFRLSVVPTLFAPDRLEMPDIVTLARKAAGLMPNP